MKLGLPEAEVLSKRWLQLQVKLLHNSEGVIACFWQAAV